MMIKIFNWFRKKNKTKSNLKKRILINVWAQFEDRRLVEFNDNTVEVQILCDYEWIVYTRGETLDLLLSYMNWFA